MTLQGHRSESANVAITWDPTTGSAESAARAWADELALLVLEPESRAHPEFLLVMTGDGLELRDTTLRRSRGIRVDFLTGRTAFRARTSSSRRQPLARAIGIKGQAPTVIDATAGLAQDAFQLACLGCRVIAIERSPILHALVRDGLERAAQRGDKRVQECLTRLALIRADSRQWLLDEAARIAPEVIYLDPMYPQQPRSAEVKKEMRSCRRLVGDDPDAAELLENARTVATRRVVLKRHRYAPPVGPHPALTIPGTRVRYDVYFPS